MWFVCERWRELEVDNEGCMKNAPKNLLLCHMLLMLLSLIERVQEVCVMDGLFRPDAGESIE